ncbi:MAG: hypothetical protein ACP5O6_11670, partial [Candidatus Baltobacteraceae bacterium]
MTHRHSAIALSSRFTAGALALALLSGCGGASSALPNAGGGAPTTSASGRIVQKLSLLLPAKGSTNSRRAPQYTSISTKGIGIALVLQGKSAPTNPATLTSPDVAIDLTTTPISIVGDLGPNGQTISCTAVTSPQPGQDCTLALSLPTDVAEIVVNAWDAPPTTGSTSFAPTAQLLSSAAAPITVTGGAPGPTIALVLDGIAASLHIVPSPQQTHFVPAGNGSAGSPPLYTEIGSGPVSVTFDALDADGNIIIGNGAPTVQWQIAQNGTSVLSGTIASGLPTNVSIAPLLTNAAALTSSYALTATAATPSGTPLSTSIAIQPAQELWLPFNGLPPSSTGRGPKSLGGSSALVGYEIPPNSGSLSMPAIPLSSDALAASAVQACPNNLVGTHAAPMNISEGIAADPSGNLWLLLATPYSGTPSGQASCVEGFAMQNAANPPQPLPNSMRLLSSTDNFSGCTIDRFDTLWCIDTTTDTLDGYNLQASGTAPFSVANVTLPISLPPAGTATTPIAIAVQPGGTNLWLAMAASVVGTSTTTTFYAREIPITTASSSAPSLGTPSNWAQFGSPYVSTVVTGSAIPVPDPPIAVDASDNIYSVDVGNVTAGAQAPLIAMWTPSLGGGSLSFGNPPNASTAYPFPGSGLGASN